MGWSRFLLGTPLVVLLSVAGCGEDVPAPPPPPAVTVAAVPERDINEWDEFTGRLEAVDVVEIRPRVSGYIQRVAFAESAAQGSSVLEMDGTSLASQEVNGLVDALLAFAKT